MPVVHSAICRLGRLMVFFTRTKSPALDLDVKNLWTVGPHSGCVAFGTVALTRNPLLKSADMELILHVSCTLLCHPSVSSQGNSIVKNREHEADATKIRCRQEIQTPPHINSIFNE